MAYLALARKWRPKSFAEVVGQTHVVKALSNALDSGRVHHAYLFTGTRGVGKTTLARIFAKSLNCETGTSAEPCQQCSTCVSVDEGRFVDLIEVDAASRTKVDDTRELLENVQYAPTSGKYKVYLIDEVHMLSGHSFNALLKTLEEPPEHVKFLFATTDPQKLPITVLSRCLQFNLRAMRPEQVENQLVKILDQEEISYELPAIQALSKAAQGSMRDGLSLLDQAIAQTRGIVNLEEVSDMLGTIKAAHSQALMQALCAQDADAVMAVIADMGDHAVDFSAAMDELLVQLYHVSLAQVAPQALNAKGLDAADFKDYAEQLSSELVQLYYQIGLRSKQDIMHAPSLRVGFEMALLRMMVFEPSSLGSSSPMTPSAEATNAPAVNSPAINQAAPQSPQPTNSHQPTNSLQPESPQLERSPQPESPQLERSPQPTNCPQPEMPAQASQPPTRQANPTAVQLDPANQQVNSVPPAVNPVPPAANQHAASQINEAPNPPQYAEQQSAAPQQSSPAAPAPKSSAPVLAEHNEWGALIEQSSLNGFTRQLAMHCACERLTEDRIELALAPRLQHLFKPERVEEIKAELNKLSGVAFEVVFTVEDSDKETPAECLERLGIEQTKQIRSDIEQQPGVQALMSEFGATIVDQSVKPV